MNGKPGYCALTTSDLFDLREGTVDIEIPPITEYYPPMRVFLAVIDEEGNRMEFSFVNGEFKGSATVNGMSVFSNSADYGEPKYWRIR